MIVLAIDPGPVQSAYALWDGSLLGFGKTANDNLKDVVVACLTSGAVVIEQVRSYGMPVGADVFDTIHWSGRFHERAAQNGVRVDLVPRKDVKLHLCQSPRANDATIRQALIDRFGPKGTKASPGVLYGITADVWSALALGVTWWDLNTGAR